MTGAADRWCVVLRNSCDHFARRKWSPSVHFVVRSWTRESGSSRRHAAVPPVPRAGDRRRAGRRARGVGEDGPPRPRGAVDGRDPGVPAGRAQRRLAAARRSAHRPERAHPDRGADAVHGRRAGVDGDARGQGRVAQARAGAPGDVPRRRRAGGVVRSVLDAAQWGAEPTQPPEFLERAAAGGRRRPCRCDLGYADRTRTETDAGRPSARSRREGFDVVPDRQHRQGAAHVPRQPRPFGRVDEATRSTDPRGSTSPRRGRTSSTTSRSPAREAPATAIVRVESARRGGAQARVRCRRSGRA